MFEKEAKRYIKTHDDYRVFALDDADLMQIFKDGAEFGFQKGIKTQVEETACCDGEQDKPNVFQQFCKKEFPEDIQRRVERAAEYGESNAEYFFRAGFFLAHELEEAKKIKTEENTKADFRIEFLFECDGIKMYRFYDCGEVRYFTTGNGRMTDSVHIKKSGESSVTRDDTVIQ